MTDGKIFDAIIIGAGHAGLAMSRCLQRIGKAHLVLERSTVGASWRTRWDSFHLNTPSHVNLLPDAAELPMDEFWSRDQWVSHLDGYRAQFELPVRTGVDVTAIQKLNDLYVVTTNDGAFRAYSVMLCSGDQNVAKTPEALSAAMPDSVTQLHTSEYRNAASLPPGAVLVVGSAQSGGQIVEDLLESHREVYLCTSRVGRAPRRYRGRDVVSWMSALGIGDQGRDEVPPEERAARQGLISGTRNGHSISLHALAHQGAKLLGRLEGIEKSTLKIGDDLMANVTFGDEAAAKLRMGLDMAISKLGLDAPPAELDDADRPFDGLEEMSRQREVELESANIRTVIWATGYTGSFAYLPDEWRDDSGLPRHVDGVCDSEGLYCLGLQWGRRRISGLVPGVLGDAERLAEHIAAR